MTPQEFPVFVDTFEKLLKGRLGALRLAQLGHAPERTPEPAKLQECENGENDCGG
jgi:hypothetical protein